MKRLITCAVAVLFLLAVPAGAASKATKDTVKDAKHECRVEYKEAKRQAAKLKTHRERVDAKRDAKRKYEECLEHAKHKS